MLVKKESLKKFLGPIVDAIPGARKLVHRLRHGKKPPPEFSGWGMSTNRVPPWKNDTELSKDFVKVNEELIQAVREGRFHMTQYAGMKDKEAKLKEFMWRFYTVFWSVRYAAGASNSSLVECGVSDGLTAFFAIKALGNSRETYLYDAWDVMQDENLLESEPSHGDYAYLTLERTQKNLKGLKAAYVKGHIPEVFKKHASPKNIAWLHIDLNASKPTTAVLEEMYESVSDGGVILFDDYGGRIFGDTRHAVDVFFVDKSGLLFPLPTGQALFFKRT